VINDVNDFPFLEPLQRNWRQVLAELQALDRNYFVDWPERDIYKGSWRVFGLYRFGQKIPELCSLCPATTALIEKIPGLETAGFSSLAPLTHITPHRGYTKSVLRAHLGLVVPDDCAIRVGSETRAWAPGSCFVCDDTQEHETWNRSASTRVVLLLDFRRDVSVKVSYPSEVLQYEPTRKIVN